MRKGGTPARLFGLAFLWVILAGGVFAAGVGYYSTPAPGRVLRPDHQIFEPSGAFGLAVGIAGWIMILAGVVIYGIRRQRGSDQSGFTKRFAVHAFLCTLGAFYVLLHTGLSFSGGASVLSWGALTVVLSVCAGAYVLGWLPEETDGRAIEMTALAARRQWLLQRLWAMTDAPPDRLERLLDREIPVGDFGPLRAFEISLRYRLRSRLRARRLRAAVAILDVPDGAVSEAVEIAAEQARVQSVLQLGGPFRLLAKYWRAVHVPLGFAVSLVVAVRLLTLASGGPP